MGAMLALSFVQIGWWVPGMMEHVRVYSTCCVSMNPSAILFSSVLMQVVFRLVMGAWAAWMLWKMRPLPDKTRIPWSLSVVIVGSLLILEQSNPYTLGYALFPIWFLLWYGKALRWNTPLLLMILASPWLFIKMGWAYQASVNVLDAQEQALIPLFVGILLTFHWLRSGRQGIPDQAVSPVTV